MELTKKQRKSLIDGLTVLKKVPNEKRLQYLDDTVKLVFDGSHLHMYKTDLVTSAVIDINYIGLPYFEVIVPLSDFLEIVKYESTTNINFVEENLVINGITILSSSYRVEDYPELPIDIIEWSSSDNGELVQGMRFCAPAIYKGNYRDNLTLLKFNKEDRDVVCTDGHRIHVFNANMDIPELMIKIGSFLPITSKIKTGTPTRYQLMGNRFCVIQDNMKVLFSISNEHIYPNYDTLWYDHISEATFSVKDLKKKLTLICKMGKNLTEVEKMIIFDPKSNNFTFKNLSFPINFSCECDRVGTNPQYLLDAIKYLSENKEVVIRVAGRNKPVTVICGDFKALIMQMEIREDEEE